MFDLTLSGISTAFVSIRDINYQMYEQFRRQLFASSLAARHDARVMWKEWPRPSAKRRVDLSAQHTS